MGKENEPQKPISEEEADEIKANLDEFLSSIQSNEEGNETEEKKETDFSKLETHELVVLAEALVTQLELHETTNMIIRNTSITFASLGKHNPEQHPPIQRFLEVFDDLKQGYLSISSYLKEILNEIEKREKLDN